MAGWKLADRGDRWLRLEAASWFMTAHLAVAHRALMPGLLRGTAARIRRLRGRKKQS